jgi:hypothetical protein
MPVTTADGVVYVAADKLYAFDGVDGRLLWTAATAGTSIDRFGYRVSFVDAAYGWIYAASQDQLFAFDPSGHLAWTTSLGGNILTKPAIANGLIFTGANNNHLYAIDASTGAIAWDYNVGGLTIRSESSPTVVDGMLFAGTTFEYSLGAFSLKSIPSKVTSYATIASTNQASTYGQPVRFAAAVAPVAGHAIPTGTIQFYVDAAAFGAPVPMSGGVSQSPEIANLGAGTHFVSAVYSGDASYNGVDSPVLTQSVAKAPLAIVASSAEKVYGQADPPVLAAGFGFVLGQSLANLAGTLNFATTSTAGSHIGFYPVVASGLTSANYAITSVNGTLSVTPAVLAIRANDATRAFGQPNSLLTASYAGFVNGDTPASLKTPVLLVAAASQFSQVGAYAIAAWGASSPDYAIALILGKLAVTPPPAGVSAADQGWMAFATTLYQEILGRNPDAAGLASWVQALDLGASPVSVANTFWNSPEHLLLLATGRAPRIAPATALADARANASIASSLAPKGPLSPAARPGRP